MNAQSHPSQDVCSRVTRVEQADQGMASLIPVLLMDRSVIIVSIYRCDSAWLLGVNVFVVGLVSFVSAKMKEAFGETFVRA